MSSDTAPVTGAEFRRACGRFATGVSIATVVDHSGVPHGLTVNSFSSVSLEPPLILICIGHAVSFRRHFLDAAYFGINVLADTQQELSERFARRGEDRFGGIDWHPGVTGVPLIPGMLAHIECAQYQRVPMGDHDIFVGEMVHACVYEGEPLIYFASTYRKLEPL
jgi:flavin reductase (DIM6/NTAB) family NADH-FMN oxidoreductase RutF